MALISSSSLFVQPQLVHRPAAAYRRGTLSPSSGRKRVEPTIRHLTLLRLQVTDQPDAILHAQTPQVHERQTSAGPARHVLMLSSTSSSLATAAEATLPTAFARILVGAALALSTVYALLTSPASSAVTGSAFSPSTSRTPASTGVDPSSPGAKTASPALPSLAVLRTPEQFDAFVLASNRAGYLAIVLFHAPWCAASQRMEKELQRLYQHVANRRVVFARVDCSIKQGIRPGQKLGSALASGFQLQRCDLTQLHRIHKTPTVRMYYNNACVDEIIGCRPIDFRQATSDLTFKYGL